MKLIQKSLVLLGAVILYVLGQYFRGYWWPNFTWPFRCAHVISGATLYCNPYVRDPLRLAWPLIAAGEILAIVSLIVLFADRGGFRKWGWMSLVYLPVSTIIVGSIGPHPATWVTAYVSPEHATWLLGYGYILLTLAVVAGTRFAAWKFPKGSRP